MSSEYTAKGGTQFTITADVVSIDRGDFFITVPTADLLEFARSVEGETNPPPTAKGQAVFLGKDIAPFVSRRTELLAMMAATMMVANAAINQWTSTKEIIRQAAEILSAVEASEQKQS